MGVKNLHRILEKYAPGCYKTTALSAYSSKKIAIDVSLYLYKYKASQGDRWPESFLSMVVTLRKNNIQCVFIYDGQAPAEKLEEQQRRRLTRDRADDKITRLEEEIKVFQETGVPGELMVSIQTKEGVPSLFRKKMVIHLPTIQARLEAMRAQRVSVTAADLELSREMFRALSIPFLMAPEEAECYASQLCLNGKVDAVMSEDTDVLAYGTPLFLTKANWTSETVVEIDYKALLQGLEMSPETFTDLCIMCSCDYNTNLPLIGPEKSVKLLKEHGRIERVVEALARGNPDRYAAEVVERLHYERCRELFQRREVEAEITECREPDWEVVARFLFEYSIRYDVARLRRFLVLPEKELENGI
jgi:5'-3' exonuclease